MARAIVASYAICGVLTGLTLHAQQPSASPPAAPQQTPPALPRPAFDTRTELVLADVTVVDRDSQPVPNLAAADFELQVNGQPRPIQSVQFISTVAANQTPATPRESGFTSNQAATTGRLLLFVVDEGNLRAGSSRTVLRTAQTLIDRLAPGDLIGLARLPYGVGNVEFTADRARLMAALGQVTGTASVRAGMSRVRISEAVALDTNDSVTWQEAVARECAGEGGPGREACATSVEGDARGLLNETSQRTQATLRAMEGLLQGLIPLQTPINVVMISEGLFVARDHLNMNELGRRAAAARATIHIIRPGQSYFDIEDQASSGASRFYDDGLLSEGLEQLAGQTRGSMTTVGASAAVAFDRLGRELSGYYLIGFEPTEADRTGRERRIRVQVKPRGLTVRARPTFVIRDTPGSPDTAAAPAAALDRLKQALASPLPARGLPIRVASYTATGTSSAQVRVIISAEIGDPAADEAEWPVGVLLLDKDDKVVVSKAGPSTLSPASAHGESPRLLLTSVLLDPGEYTLRIAAVDGNGRAGSVHHTINAGLTPLPGKLNVSDLVLVAQPAKPGDTPRPRPSSVIDNDTMSAMLEMTSTDRGVLGRARVAVQIADSAAGPALVAANAMQASRADGQRAYAATLKLGILPPGEYLARAIVTVPGQPETRIVRPFLLAPPAPAATAEPAADRKEPIDPDAPPAPLAPVKILAPVPSFQPQTVMAAGVLSPFLDGLADLHPPSPAVEALVEEARNGRFNASETPGATPDDEVVLTFIRGLGAYQKGDVPRASAWFQQTLKGASDFLGAAFYLGACHAASGRDRDAIGAWQMALLSENPGAVYPALVDALLRVGDGRQAVEFLEEAPSAWADDNERLRREATAEAMLGDYAGALPKLVDLLHAQKGDQNLLFVAIQVLYRMQLEGNRFTVKDRALFADYVERHQQMGGPNKALVETWRKYVLK